MNAMLPPGEIRVRDLTVTHGRRPAVHHVNFSLKPGAMMAVVGPNGAGKSTLLRAIAGLHAPSSGRIEGVAPGQVALLPQQAALDRQFPLTCRDAVLLGLWAESGAFRAIARPERIEAALDAVGLHGFARRPVSSLSSGQFQRLLFARLLMQDAPVILLDEPFNALDARTSADLLAVMRRWHGEGRSILAVLHDIDLVRREFPETLVLAREAIACGPTDAALSAENRLKARMMSEAWAEQAEACAA
ncbi:metal ABC transporter ATP-binding protein [Roseococcus sp. YIM B11640]|uniref:metal ABC transporter ATP-binding protein n=1 Tax=Roseococcus sp. YIM B11640 TaxID=3133973 RepID=UPI003C7CA75C